MDVPYCDNPSGTLSVRVELQHTSDVYLVDQANFDAKRSGRDFKYFGGNYSHSPVSITVNGAGRWYLIVDNGSGESYRYQWSK